MGRFVFPFEGITVCGSATRCHQRKRFLSCGSSGLRRRRES